MMKARTSSGSLTSSSEPELVKVICNYLDRTQDWGELFEQHLLSMQVVRILPPEMGEK